MNTADLPDSVFMIGTRESRTKFNCDGRKLSNGICVVCIWTSQQKLDDWLAHHNKTSAHFEIETPLAFSGLFSIPAIRYALVDPICDENPYAGSFIVDTFPDNRKIDLYSITDVWSAYSVGLIERGISKDTLERVRQFGASHPEIKPFELVNKLTQETEHQDDLVNQTARELLTKGLFDQAWALVSQHMDSTTSPNNQQLIKDIWKAYPDFRATEAMEYATNLFQRKIGDLKAKGDFEYIWRHCEAELQGMNTSKEIIERARNVTIASDELTWGQAMEKAEQSLKVIKESIEKIPEPLRKALFQFPPPSECRQCDEQQWTFVSLSPNEKSATWKCSYCGKVVVVKSDDIKRRAVSVTREPIPKEVQREVWQRDCGKCVVCGSQERLEFDHIIAHSKGGANTARNLQLLCESCNRKKSAKNPGED
jgi:5-methylcytosine-specific restriction endonuclease McrA